MKKLKYVLIIFFAIFSFAIKSNAATGNGLCYNKELYSDGYCQIDGVTISSKELVNRPLNFSDGITAVKFGYHGYINSIDQDMFCIDANYQSPDRPYIYARPFNLDDNYDRAIAKVYSLYINAIVWDMGNSGRDFNTEKSKYLQTINVVMRAITAKFGYHLSGGSSTALENTLEKYKNIYKQLDGQNVAGLSTSNWDAFMLAQRWYCGAILTVKDANVVNQADINHCNGIEKVETWDPSKIEITVSPENENITDEYNGYKFTKTVPVKITGLAPLKDPVFQKTEPYFKVKSVTCEKVSCTLEDPGLITNDWNILNNMADNQDEYVFKVRVTGDQQNFKDETSIKINISYEYRYVLDSNNLAVLRYNREKQEKQRMIVLMPYNGQSKHLEIPVTVPSMCNSEVNASGVQIYKYGSTEKSELAYLESGCCDVDPKYLKDPKAITHYQNNCNAKDIVNLKSACNNETQNCTKAATPTEMLHSYVHQSNIDSVINKVTNAENEYTKGRYSEKNLNKVLNNLSNNQDDEYIKTLSENNRAKALSEDNNYCKLYTSESVDIYYPGTTEATSGRFFIFQENQQPRVEGTISAVFHTNYDKWLDDYNRAIKAEKAAYTAWQTAEAVYDAIINTQYSSSGNCYDEGEISGSYTTYKGSTYQYFNDSEGNRITRNVRYTSGCRDSQSYTNNQANGTEKTKALTAYNNAKQKRKNLQEYKTECENKSILKDNWTYDFGPTLTFSYAVNENGKQDTKTQDMQISYNSSKYWPNVSTNPEITNSDYLQTITKDKNTGVSYGGTGGGYVNDYFEYSSNKDSRLGYKQTLYYKPTKSYYSLVPNGDVQEATEIIKTKDTNYLDLGYVFDVEITNYKGEYETWFDISNVGHLKSKANVQKSIKGYLEENKLKFKNATEFSSKCIYCDTEILFQRDCITCEKDEDFKPQYFYRTVSITNLDPNNRQTTGNWSTTKGKSAKKAIEKAKDAVYNDKSEYLEYSFTLSPQKMQEIKNEAKNYAGSIYNSFELDCKSHGKECESHFLTELAKASGTSDLLNKTRASKWKYYKAEENKFVTGSIKTSLNGVYPDERTDAAILP